MKLLTKRFVLHLSLLSALIILIAWLTNQESSSRPSGATNTAVSPASGASNGAPYDPHAGIQPIASSRPSHPQSIDEAQILARPLGRRWRDRLASSQGDRAFVLAARGSPADGGWLYAGHAVDACSGTAAALSLSEVHAPDLAVSHPNYQRAVEFLQLLKARCAQLTPSELKEFSVSAALRSNGPSPDPLLELIRAYVQAFDSGDSVARRAALQSVLNYQDPLVLEALGARIATHRVDGVTVIKSGSRILPVRDSPAELEAYYLLPCEFGLPCGLTDPQLGIGCTTGSECFRDRYEKILYGTYGGDKERYAEMLRLLEQVVASVRRRDVDFFLRR